MNHRFRKGALCLVSVLALSAGVLFPSRAMDAPSQLCLLEESAGKIAAEFVYLYPPGIPIIVPGEQITGLFTRNVRRYMEQGLNLHGLCGENNETISVVKEQAEV